MDQLVEHLPSKCKALNSNQPTNQKHIYLSKELGYTLFLNSFLMLMNLY
jgi:hypothetical protein